MTELKNRTKVKSKSGSNGQPIQSNSTKSHSNSKVSYYKDLFKGTITSLGALILLNFVLSYLVTETWTWGYHNQYTNWRNYIPRNLVLTEEELAKYDGSNPNLPIYLAIDGEVYDVSTGPSYYGKGGGYSFFSGKDAARAFVTGCFKTHLTHDLRGFDEADMESVKGWKDFFRNHGTYYRIGKVIHSPIEPDSPIPEDCNDGKRRSSSTIRKVTE